MVFLQSVLIGFVDIDPNKVRVVLISVSICQTLQQNLYESETPAGGSRKQTHLLLHNVRDNVFSMYSCLFSHVIATEVSVLRRMFVKQKSEKCDLHLSSEDFCSL